MLAMYLTRILVLPQTYELRVAEVIVRRPLDKLKLTHKQWL